jgi:hypothetical protein
MRSPFQKQAQCALLNKASAAAAAAAQAAVQNCVPGTNNVLEISTAKDAVALTEAIVFPAVTLRAALSGSVQPIDTITAGAKSKLTISASEAL